MAETLCPNLSSFIFLLPDEQPFREFAAPEDFHSAPGPRWPSSGGEAGVGGRRLGGLLAVGGEDVRADHRREQVARDRQRVGSGGHLRGRAAACGHPAGPGDRAPVPRLSPEGQGIFNFPTVLRQNC